MIVESCKLTNFRNYGTLELNLDPHTNIFYGDNAQGKTNILESIYVGGTTKSHRSKKDKEMILFGEEEAHIDLHVKKRDISYHIDMHLRQNKSKYVAINKVPIQKAADLFGIVNLVFFSPEDLNIIKNSPAERRRFMDMQLCQLDKIYMHDLTQYQKIVAQRNKLLKDMMGNPSLKDTLDIWDVQLIEFGERVIRKRQEFVKEMNSYIRDIHEKLTGQTEEISVIYEPNTGDHSLEEELMRCREKDMHLHTTSAGPHRDDLKFTANDIDIRTFGSQGQQRTAALSLKLTEIELVRNQIHDTPVLLLDDVLSELDKNRQEYLLESMSDVQTLITCTGLDDFVNHRFKLDRVFHVTDGKVSKEN